MSPEALKGDSTSEAKTSVHNHYRNDRVEKQLAAERIENKNLRTTARQLNHYFLIALPTSSRLCTRKRPQIKPQPDDRFEPL